MSGVFVSYRRVDSSGSAGRLFDRLKGHFGRDAVFMDIEGGIERGDDFAAVIDRALESVNALLVVIGPQWLACTNADGTRRLDSPDDWVRNEIETGLRRGIPVLPILVDGASIPTARDLPPSLAAFARRQASEISNSRWTYDVGEIIKRLDAVVSQLPAKNHAPDLAEKRAQRFGWMEWVVAGSLLLAIGAAGILRWRSLSPSPIPAQPGSTSTSRSVLPAPTRTATIEPLQKPAPSPQEFTGTIPFGGEVRGIAFSPDGKFIATGTGNTHATILWSAATGKQVKLLIGNSVVSSVAFSADSQQVASDSNVYDVATGERLAALDHGGYAVAFSSDGRFVANASGNSQSLGTRVFDRRTGAMIKQVSSEYANRLAFSQDSRRLASATGYLAKGVRIWDLESYELVRTLEGPSNDVSFSSDGKYVATAGGGIVRLFRATTWERLRDIPGEIVAFSPKGGVLATVGEDRRVRLYDPANGDPIRTLPDVYANELAFSPDGERIATAGPGSSIQVASVK